MRSQQVALGAPESWRPDWQAAQATGSVGHTQPSRKRTESTYFSAKCDPLKHRAISKKVPSHGFRVFAELRIQNLVPFPSNLLNCTFFLPRSSPQNAPRWLSTCTYVLRLTSSSPLTSNPPLPETQPHTETRCAPHCLMSVILTTTACLLLPRPRSAPIFSSSASSLLRVVLFFSSALPTFSQTRLHLSALTLFPLLQKSLHRLTLEANPNCRCGLFTVTSHSGELAKPSSAHTIKNVLGTSHSAFDPPCNPHGT